MFNSGSRDIESSVNRLYQAFQSTANRYRYTFQRPTVTVGGKPSVIFLGNHSSGKSTIINHLLGETPVQDTGVAPTDDCFTIILYGDVEQDYYGPAAVGQLPSEFASVVSMGPAFLQHLRVKFRKREYLKRMNIIDSPGMIDTAEGLSKRGYDFIGAVRNFSEIADLIFFLFDPDKPGTTSETVTVLSRCTFGIEFKLRLLLNKVDTFDSMYDFARAYGTLCWNLARVLQTKDLPKIYTTYTPRVETHANAKVDLTGFEKHHADLISQLQNISQRRFDSLLANVSADFTRLAIQSQVLSAVAWQLFTRRMWQLALFCVGTVVSCAGCWLTFIYWLWPSLQQLSASSWQRIFAYLLVAILTGGVSLGIAILNHYSFRRYRASIVTSIDRIFEKEHAETLAIGVRDDLRQYWGTIRKDVVSVIASGIRLPLFGWGRKQRLENVLVETLPSLISKSRKSVQKGN